MKCTERKARAIVDDEDGSSLLLARNGIIKTINWHVDGDSTVTSSRYNYESLEVRRDATDLVSDVINYLITSSGLLPFPTYSFPFFPFVARCTIAITLDFTKLNWIRSSDRESKTRHVFTLSFRRISIKYLSSRTEYINDSTDHTRSRRYSVHEFPSSCGVLTIKRYQALAPACTIITLNAK